MERNTLQATMDYSAAPRGRREDGDRFISVNPRMRELESVLAQVGWSDAPVLIQGETGSGKEVIASRLHACSPRAAKPFLKLNCAALPSDLVESELFGYERGAFTGAFQRKPGMFEMADGGTILLDEIGDMDVRLQARLLQVLQDQQFRRLGGSETIHVDVRIMAATHRDLESAMASGSFRADLYYRLNVIALHLPALRERPEDIMPLAGYLMARWATAAAADATLMTPDLQHAMTAYLWPGNVRELENFVRKLLILRAPATAARELFTKSERALVIARAAEERPGAPVLEQVTQAKRQAETDAILAALGATHWNRKQAAELLRIDYKALLYKMKKLGVEDRGAEPRKAFAAAAS
jgi:two-component system response regulator AtoC